MGVLWAMSPAGGQASLRILYRANQTSVSSTSIRYMDTGPLGFLCTYMTLFEGYDMEFNQTGDFPFSMASSLAAALMQNVETKSGPRDSWGSPKVPRLDMVDESTADENGWIQVSQSPAVESFTSLFGLPLLGIPDHGTVEFGIESAYVQFGNATVEQVEPFASSSSVEATCSTCINNFRDLSDPGVSPGRVARLLGPPWTQPNSSQLSQESFTNANHVRIAQSRTGTFVSSEVTQVLVETYIVCEEGLCRATKIRPSTTDHRPENITAFDFWGVVALDMLNHANGNIQWSPTLLELFMNETSTIPVYHASTWLDAAEAYWPNLAKVEPVILSRRVTLLLNSAIHLLYSYYGFAGALPPVESVDYGPPHTPSGGLSAAAAAYNVTTPGEHMSDVDQYVQNIVSRGAAFVAASTEASVTQKTVIYKADYVYVTVLVISSLALTITGLVGMIMGLRTREPDVFDPVMGLTYNNSSLGLPNPGSTLDANARAKLLRGMRVRLGDVAGEKSVGMVGVGRTPEVEPLVQGRLYE
ncbi:hypothetical protein J7T55_001114 [Diaporthe amygdali]|uniref:uncharacterized protein n=1 Tax=Phomopsis amygdali TaxID=1214568 RepID=UPI0022FED9BE|nr:uncharacterized protein J7T55_001114 [Diaporthe amygdali]KAJ0120257.1 hypothetical protein J7T55_001114 [Diaporthe amygdali]